MWDLWSVLSAYAYGHTTSENIPIFSIDKIIEQLCDHIGILQFEVSAVIH